MTSAEYSKRLDLLKENIARIIQQAPYLKAQDLLGLMLYRIFNEGRDSQGAPIGAYKGGKGATYKALRNRKGLRIDTVDLQFTGELFRSIQNGIEGEFGVVGFTNKDRTKVADYLEEKYKKPIFAPTEKEQEQAKTLMLDFVRNEIAESLKTIFG